MEIQYVNDRSHLKPLKCPTPFITFMRIKHLLTPIVRNLTNNHAPHRQ